MHVCKEFEGCPEDRLPFLVSFRGRHVHFDELLEDHVADRKDELAECTAFLAILLDHIRPTWMQAIWSDEALYSFVIQPLYEANLSWPLRTLLSRRQRQRILAGAQPSAFYRQGLETITKRLGESRFFGGDTPSALDACLGADLVLIPFFLPASHELHRAFMGFHELYEYSLHLLEYLKA